MYLETDVFVEPDAPREFILKTEVNTRFNSKEPYV